jgi:hypothetical protein
MDVIVVLISIIVGLGWGLLLGNYFGQGVMIKCMMDSDEPIEAIIGECWHKTFQWGVENEKDFINRLVAKIVLLGIESSEKSGNEKGLT